MATWRKAEGGSGAVGGRRAPRLAAVCLLLVACCPVVTACQPARLAGREPPRGQTLRINVAGGFGYLPLLLMQERRLLERRVPGLSVEWKAIPTPEAVNEALASGVLDIATGSPTAALLAHERGVPARALAGVAELPLGLVSNRPNARTVRDLGSGDRIAVPALDSHEHMVVRVAALRELGDWQALDPLVVPRAHPEAFAALLARREVTAHVATTPYLDRELETPNLRRLLDGADVMGGPAMGVVAYTTPALRERQAALFGVFLEALREATALAERDVGEATRLLTAGDGSRFAPEALARYLDHPDLRFSTQVRGLPRLATFLHYTGQYQRIPTSRQELLFDDVSES